MPTRRKKSSVARKGRRTGAKRAGTKARARKTKSTAKKRASGRATSSRAKKSATASSRGRKAAPRRGKSAAVSRRRSAAVPAVKETAMKVLAGAAAGAVRAVIPPLEEIAGKSEETAGIDHEERGGGQPAE